MTTSQILEGDLKLNPNTMTVLANLRQAKSEIDAIYAALGSGVGLTQAALDALYVVTQNNITGDLEVAGVPITVTNTAYATVAAMTAATPATNTVSLLTPAAFTGTGKPTVGVPVIYNGTEWEPLGGRQKLFKCMFGTQASPTKNISSATRFALTADPIIPGGLLAANGHALEILARVQKHGAAATAAFRVWMGTSATYTNNSFLVPWNITITDLMSSTILTEVIRTSATTLFTSSFAPSNNNAGASTFADKNTLIDFNADQYVTFAMQTLTAPDNFDLLEMEIFWKSGVTA